MTVKINDIVSGEVTQSWLRVFLNQHPESLHPLDVERFDLFIVALHKYKSNYNKELFEKHLKTDLRWADHIIQFYLSRVSIGLDVLRARLSFGGAYLNSLNND